MGELIRATVAQPLISFDEMERMAESFAASGLFGAKTKAQALSLLMIAQAEGMPPGLAMQEYDIIEGKPARKSERIQARFQLSGGKIKYLRYEDECVEAEFSHPQGSTVVVKWDKERASKTMYYTKDGWKPLAGKANWKNYMRQMCKARTISEGCKACYPAYALVTLSTEEAIDGGVLDSEVLQQNDEPALEFIEGAEKDNLVSAWNKRMRQSTTPEEIDAVMAEADDVRQRLSQAVWGGLEHVAAQEHERVCAGEAPRPELPSPFEELKEQGLACLTAEDRVAAFRAFEARAKSRSLIDRCSEDERAELRSIWKQVRDDIHPPKRKPKDQAQIDAD